MRWPDITTRPGPCKLLPKRKAKALCWPFTLFVFILNFLFFLTYLLSVDFQLCSFSPPSLWHPFVNLISCYKRTWDHRGIYQKTWRKQTRLLLPLGGSLTTCLGSFKSLFCHTSHICLLASSHFPDFLMAVACTLQTLASDNLHALGQFLLFWISGAGLQRPGPGGDLSGHSPHHMLAFGSSDFNKLLGDLVTGVGNLQVQQSQCSAHHCLCQLSKMSSLVCYHYQIDVAVNCFRVLGFCSCNVRLFSSGN